METGFDTSSTFVMDKYKLYSDYKANKDAKTKRAMLENQSHLQGLDFNDTKRTTLEMTYNCVMQ